MKAIVQTGPQSVEVKSVEKPAVESGEVLVRVHSAGLCGSDAHAYLYEDGYEWINIPRVMGHEYSGTILEVGSDVSEFERGDRVVEEPTANCGQCFQCQNGQSNVCQDFSLKGMHRDGAYAEYTTARAENLHRVPKNVPLGSAALTEPLSIATRAVFSRSELTPGDTVLVEGPGPIGVLVAMVADSMGANVLVSGLDKDRKYRLPLLNELGIDTVSVESEELESVRDRQTDGIGFDVVFDTTGHRSGIEMATDHVRKGGQIVIIGLPGSTSSLDVASIVRNEITVETSYGSAWRNFEQALRLMEDDIVDPEQIIDHSYSPFNPEEAFLTFLNSETSKPVFDFRREDWSTK